MLSTMGLGSKNQFWANLAQTTYQAVTPETYFQFYKQILILSRIERKI